MARAEKLDSELNVIIADTEWQTFEVLSKLGRDFNFINLSSDFAVNFILDYEKVDVVILSKRISNLEEISKKAKKKKASLYIFGKDLKYPVDVDEIKNILEEERASRNQVDKYGKDKGIRKYFKRLFSSNPESEKLDDYWDKVAGKDLIEHEEKISSNDLFKTEEKISGMDLFEPADKASKDDLLESDNDLLEYKTDLGKSNLIESKEITEKDFWGVDKEVSKLETRGNEENADLFQKVPQKDSYESSTPKNTVAIKQKIIVFTKAKGGVGSTLLSLFLAHEFRKLKTLLIDLNFSEGGSDLGYYLNIPKVPNMIIFTEGYNRIAMDNSIINIRENFDVLQSPPTYELSKKLDLQDIYSLVDIARKKYHLIIFDLPNLINEIYLGVLDMADLVVMVSDFTLGSVGRLVSINNRFIYNDLEKILVMNRARNGNGFAFTKNQLKEFFNLKELLILNENGILSGRTDFTNLNFSSLKEFNNLTTKVLELLTCD
jgi:cellulose biosynthesis protein BcsQ